MKEGRKRKPVPAVVMIVCDRQDCQHRTQKGYCGVGDPHWDWCRVQHTTHRVDCYTYDRRT